MAKIAFCALVVALGPAPVRAGGRGDRVEYVGGTIVELPKSASGLIDITGDRYFHFETRSAIVEVPYQSINVLEYGENVGPRYYLAFSPPMFLLSKKRTHFLTIGYEDDNGRQQALVFRVGKGDIRALLACLEARTGRKVEYQDVEARKRGKG
ncbi:MAG TPA: hypothetical protein VN893_22305 [Bryobacteraceae bacterium]|nr:hypothetical protein [Bryobacteraceae bacterium]